MELFSIQLQIFMLTSNHKMLKETYERALKVRCAIPHPLHMGVIHECGGVMHARAGNWAQSGTCFFDAFRSYDEAGNARRIDCLRYLVLSKIMSPDAVDVLEAPEVKPFVALPEVAVMTELLALHRVGDTKSFIALLSQHPSLLSDSFIATHLQTLLGHIRSMALLTNIKPFTRVRLDYLAECVGVSVKEVENLLIPHILEGRVSGRINELEGVVTIGRVSEQGGEELEKWRERLESVWKGVVGIMM